MRKIYFFLCLLFAVNSFVLAQDKTDTTKTTFEEFIAKRIAVPPSPTAASLGQYGDYPVSNYTGVPAISIPLVDASGRNLQVAVTLSYHASGIKTQQMSSWVGLGWALSAGGVITRTIYGLSDESASGLRGTQSRKEDIQDYINCIYGAGSNCDFTHYYLLQNIANGFIDSEPDVYSINFMGKSGKIVFDYDGVPQMIPYQKMNVVFDNVNNRFTVTDDMGTVYLFDQTEASQNTTASEGYAPNGGTTAWYLSKVTSIHGEEMIFTYTTENVSYDQSVSQIKTYQAHDFEECQSGISTLNVSANYTSETNVLQKISTINEDIFFELTTPSDVPCYENAPLWEVATPLKRIIKKDKQGNVKMGFRFYYSCYPNSNRRLRLDSLKMFGSDTTFLPAHIFDYTETINMPSWTDDHQDYWGYNNGQSSTNGSYFPPYNNANIFGIYTNLEGYNREPDAQEVKAFSLKKITYPTGGYTEFDFEINTYGFRGAVTNQSGSQNGAGLRIHKITSFDGLQNTGIKLFDYSLAANQSLSSGSIITLPVYDYYSEYYVPMNGNPLLRRLCRSYQRSSNPKNFLSETQGSQIGYREVTVFEGLNGENGKSNYRYTSPYDYNDTGSNIFPFAPLTSKDHKRGLLTEETIFKKTAIGYDTVRHTVNTYKLDETANQSKRTYVKVGIKRRSLGDSPNSGSENLYETEPYDYLSEWVYLTNTMTKNYLDGAIIAQNTAFTYNPYNIQLKTISTTGSNNEVYRTTYVYPNEQNLVLLVNRHIIREPIEVIKELDNSLVYKKVDTYGTTPIGNPVIIKTEVYPTGVIANDSKVSESYTYNDYGNIIETERNESGIKTAYLWGYNYSRILCAAQNIPYSSLVNTFSVNNLTLAEFTNDTTTTDQKQRIRSFLNGLGNTSVGTFYTYDVIRGLTSRFNTNGLIESYFYDTFGRLKYVKDNQGNLTDLYNYQFRK